MDPAPEQGGPGDRCAPGCASHLLPGQPKAVCQIMERWAKGTEAFEGSGQYGELWSRAGSPGFSWPPGHLRQERELENRGGHTRQVTASQVGAALTNHHAGAHSLRSGGDHFRAGWDQRPLQGLPLSKQN